MSEYKEDLDKLEEAGKIVELFCLCPSWYKDKEIDLRLRIKEKWTGWKIKNNIVNKLGLTEGATICVPITPRFTDGLSDEVDGITLFVSGNGIDWIVNNKVTAGSVIDCRVKLSYVNLANDSETEKFFAANLIFEEGYKVIDEIPQEKNVESVLSLNDLFANIDP